MEETRIANINHGAIAEYSGGGGEINHVAEEDNLMHVVAKVRLGQRKGEKKFPDGKYKHFFLQDPGTGPNEYHKMIIAKYGENPERLPIRFISPRMADMIPSAYKWYKGGSLFKDGTVKSGERMCVGDGPHRDGTPGEARFFAKKDPITQIVPVRECHGENCPDFKDGQGRPQCKPTMSITFMMPDCIMGGMLQCNTSSKNSMRNIRRQLAWGLQIPILRDNWHQVPWVLYRKRIETKFINPAKKTEEKGHAYIVEVQFDEQEFMRLMAEGKIGARGEPQVVLPQAPIDDALAPDDLYEVEAVNNGPDEAEQVLNDPEVVALFEELEKASGRKLTTKSRLLGIRAKGSGPELKARVINATQQAIMKAMAQTDANQAQRSTPADAPKGGIL